MGWNRLTVQRDHPVLAGLAEGAFAYFVHSYALSDGVPEQCLATTAYGGELVAVTGQANYIGTQFHPEKSQATGLRLLENFLRWRPE
jgi:glutamine amidotransferase